MDDFTYNYYELNNSGIVPNYRSNRLSYVTDAVTNSTYDEDLKHGQQQANYEYNRIGELIKDEQEGMILYWRYGDHKLAKVERTNEDSPEVEYIYDPLGTRAAKIVKPRQNSQLSPQEDWEVHYYAYNGHSLSRCIFLWL